MAWRSGVNQCLWYATTSRSLLLDSIYYMCKVFRAKQGVKLGVYLSWEHEYCDWVRLYCNDLLLIFYILDFCLQHPLASQPRGWYPIFWFQYRFVRFLITAPTYTLACQPSCFSWTLASLNLLVFLYLYSNIYICHISNLNFMCLQ